MTLKITHVNRGFTVSLIFQASFAVYEVAGVLSHWGAPFILHVMDDHWNMFSLSHGDGWGFARGLSGLMLVADMKGMGMYWAYEYLIVLIGIS